MLLTNCVYFYDNELKKGHIQIKNSKIHKIFSDSPLEELIQKNSTLQELSQIDCKDLLIIPGLIDAHVHFRDFKQSYKETLLSGSKAAISSGVTTVIAMPNTNPSLTNKTVIEKYRNTTKNPYCNIGLYARVSGELSIKTLPEIKRSGIFGLKIYPKDKSEGFPLSWPIEWHKDLDKDQFAKYLEKGLNNNDLKRKGWKQLFDAAKSQSLPILIHPELLQSHEKYSDIISSSSIENNTLCEHSKNHPIQGNERAIVQQIIIMFHSFYPNPKNAPHIHLCHVSSNQIVELVSEHLKLKGYSASIEVTPHHLFLNYEQHKEDKKEREAFRKVLCPLRSEKEQKQLYKLLTTERQIDTIGTDHAPHTFDEKTEHGFEGAPSGFPYMDVASRFLLSQVFSYKMSLSNLVKYYSTNPAKIFNIPNKGIIQEGYDADLVIIEKVEPYTIDTSTFLSKQKWSPFEKSEELSAKIKKVILGGKIVVDNGKLVEANGKYI